MDGLYQIVEKQEEKERMIKYIRSFFFNMCLYVKSKFLCKVFFADWEENRPQYRSTADKNISDK